MLTLNDGRTELWQWDTGRNLTVDADCSQVHFSNKVFGRSIDVDVVDGVATIPDILLQTDKDLSVWAFVGTPENGYTKISKVFKVNKRNKPANYVFTPTEQTTLGQIMERLDDLEAMQDPDAIKNAVDEYLANNPIQIDEKDPTVPDWAKQTTKPKYTATEVGAVAKVNGVKPDANGNVEITIPDSGGNVDLTGYATEKYVREYAQPKGDYLTEVPEGYAKTEDIPKKPGDIGAQPAGNYLTEVPSDYATKEFVTNKIAEAELGGEEVDLSGYAQKSELPTKVSQLQNDAGYLTAVPDEYAKTADIPTKPSDIGAQPEGDYALRSEIPSVPVKSVNGKTGAVSLTAADVKARPDNWMPTASDVGALPSSTVIPTVPTKVSAFTNDAGYLTQHQDISGLAAKFDPTVYGLPVLYLTGDISPIKISKDNKATLSYVYGDRSGTCTLKGQGNTSYTIAQNLGDKGKYNYTINFDTAFEVVEGWGEQKKYCLKGNWNDPTQARNVVTAKLWGLMAESRADVPEWMAALPNAGAVDGFPIVIMLNGEFHGLYTWNIPKDEWMFGFGAGTHEAFISADEPANDTLFKGETLLDTEGMELEYATDDNESGWVTESLNRAINACVNSTGGDLDTTIAQYIDWPSEIDMYILVAIIRGADNVGKNYLMATKDGVKWYKVPYDMDLTYGMGFKCADVARPVSNVSFTDLADSHRVYELIKRFKTDALKSRYWKLRANTLSESRIVQYFENFSIPIALPVVVEDVKRYPSISGSCVFNIDQIARWVRQRLETTDKWVNALPAQETPESGGTETTYAVTNMLTGCASSNSASTITAESTYSAKITANDGYTLDGATVTITMGGTDITSTAYADGVITIASVTGPVVISIAAVVEEVVSGYINQVPISTNTDGTIFNDTGYKENVRLSSSGGISGSSLNGSVTTGFIPYTYTDIVRMRGAKWLNAKSYDLMYFNAYDSNKKFLWAISCGSYTGGVFSGASVTYDESTGVTTFDFSKGNDGAQWFEAFKSAAYFRLNAEGKGTDLIVTVNQEITE